MRNSRRAYTLIELLTVMILLSVLVALLVPVIGNAMQKADMVKAKIQLEKLVTAVERYHRAFGEYPPNLSYEHLGRPQFSQNFGRLDPILQFETESVYDTNAPQNAWVYKDPWDKPYVYYFPGMTQPSQIPVPRGPNHNVPNVSGIPYVADITRRALQDNFVPVTEYLLLIGGAPNSGSAGDGSYWEVMGKLDQIVDVSNPKTFRYEHDPNDFTTRNRWVARFPIPADPRSQEEQLAGHKLVHGFLIWSRGPNRITGGTFEDRATRYTQEADTDDIGNWGFGREST